MLGPGRGPQQPKNFKSRKSCWRFDLIHSEYLLNNDNFDDITSKAEVSDTDDPTENGQHTYIFTAPDLKHIAVTSSSGASKSRCYAVVR